MTKVKIKQQDKH